jgi:prohibitin 1
MSSSVPSKEGLLIKLETSVLYHVNPESVIDIYTTIGQNYSQVLLDPQFRSSIRTITSNYEAKALYSRESREKMSQELKDELKRQVEHRGFIIEEAPLRDIELPEKLTTAIELKLSAEQESQRMKFVLEREKLEAERKKIEAEGIAQFQKIVTEGISEQLLVWKGIEATEKLAESPNSKVIVIGGKNGLPLILDGK